MGQSDGLSDCALNVPICISRTDASALDSFTVQKSSNYFKSAQWSPDGTSIITSSADNGIRTLIVPQDLLDEAAQPHTLTPYSNIPSTEPVKALDCYPHFALSDPSTTLVLSSVRDHPIRLNSALDGTRLAAYPLVNPTTEAYISPHCLLFTRDGAQFVAGSENLISVFDVSRVGDGPASWLPTGSKKKAGTVDGLMSMKGIVSSIAIDTASGLLAAGTFTRHVGLYSSEGRGECVGVFRVEGTDADKIVGGSGVTKVFWSPCGRYLYIAERKSDGVMFYDIRKTGQLLGWLEGRNARTNQRLGVDVLGSEVHLEIWAGGSDGTVRRWYDPHQLEGAIRPSLEWDAHEDVVTSASMHPGGGVLASSSGQRHLRETKADNSLKIWTWKDDLKTRSENHAANRDCAT